MNSEAEFIAAIASSPGDELAYRALADWLEERGDPRAAWVRSPVVRPWMGPNFESPVNALLEAFRRGENATRALRPAAEVGAAMVPGLVELLKHEEAGVRYRAIHCCRRLKKAAADAVPALVEALKDPEPGVRELAARAIKDCGAKKVADASAVQAALADRNPGVRRQAASLLGSMGAKGETVEQLTRQLDDADEAVRLSAVEGLGALRTRPAIAPLCRALADQSARARVRAAQWLECRLKAGMAEALAPIRQALRDPEAKVRASAAGALFRLGKGATAATADLMSLLDDEDREVRRGAISSLCAIGAGDDAALVALERLTADPDPEVAHLAAFAMEEWPTLPERSAAPLLALALRLPHRRAEAVRAMGRLDRVPPDVFAFLRQCARQRDGYACAALGLIGPRAAEAVPDVFEAAREPNFAAAQALGHMGPEGVARLVELLGGPDPLPRYAVCGLRNAKEGALPALPRLLAFFRPDAVSDNLTWLRQEACETIAAIGPAARDAVPTLLDQLGTHWGSKARAALVAMGPALAPFLPALAGVLRDPARYSSHPDVAELLASTMPYTPEVAAPLREAIRVAAPVHEADEGRDRAAERTRAAAARAFGSSFLGEVVHEALPELLPLARDPAAVVRQAAVAALGEVRRPEAVEGLRAALRDADEKVRALAAAALGNAGEACPELVTALRDDSARVRREAATALGKIKAGGEEVLAALRLAEKDADKGVRREANAALKKTEGKPKRDR